MATIFIVFLINFQQETSPAPPGIHGEYSINELNGYYLTNFNKDTLLKRLKLEGLIIKSGRINDYDPPWDSLRYLVDNIKCGNQKIKAYIEFGKVDHDSLTHFRILWINGPANTSKDTLIYNNIARKYYSCFGEIFKKYCMNKE